MFARLQLNFVMKGVRIRLSKVQGSFEVEGYNHIDYVVATDCADTVYLPIAKIVRGRESDMCSQ